MHYSVTLAFALSLLSHAARASPIAPGVSDLANPTLSEPRTRQNVTLPGPPIDFPIRLAARQEFPATLLLCSVAGCSSGCEQINLADEFEEVCLTADNPIHSAMIFQPSGQGLPFSVGIGQKGCGQESFISRVNSCQGFTGQQGFSLVP